MYVYMYIYSVVVIVVVVVVPFYFRFNDTRVYRRVARYLSSQLLSRRQWRRASPRSKWPTRP